MIRRQAWANHEFNLGLDPGWAENLITRISHLIPRIKHQLKDIEESILCYKKGLSWSIKEHIGHLIDLEQLHIQRLQEFQQGRDILSAADMTNLATEKGRHNSKKIKDLIKELTEKRNETLSTFHSISEDYLTHSAKHERLGVRMKPVDLLHFIGEHDDHHLTSIQKIITLWKKWDGYIIENSTLTDLDRGCELFEEAIQFQKTNGLPEYVTADRPLQEKDILDKNHYKVIHQGKMIAMFCLWYEDKKIWRHHDIGESIFLHRVVVDNQYKGNGITGFIIEWVKQKAIQLGKKNIRIDTWDNNPKLTNYYNTYGFEFVESFLIPIEGDLPKNCQGNQVALMEYKL